MRLRWQKDGVTFTTMVQQKDGAREFLKGNATSKKMEPIFNKEKIAVAMRPYLKADQQTSSVNFTNADFDLDNKTATVEMHGRWYKVDLKNYKADTTSAPEGFERRAGRGNFNRGDWERMNWLSPDKKWQVLVKDDNLILQNTNTYASFVLTKDGTKDSSYGNVSWSPDSKYVIANRIHRVEEEKVYRILSSVPGTTRGQLVSQPYAQPGDDNTSFEPFIFSVEDRKPVKLNVPIIDFNGSPRINWDSDNIHFYVEKPDRGHQRYRIFKANAKTGETTALLDEKTNTFIYLSRVFTQYLPESNEIIWSSEKDGYRHLYLINTATAAVVPITSGNWVVRNIDSVDTKKREIWFSAVGKNTGEDPYNNHNYRIGFNGGNLMELTPALGNHQVVFSPDKKYYTDTYSQVNVPPVHELRRSADGAKVMDLGKADVSYLEENHLKPPVPFVSKARDGVTDIYGIACFPSQMDKNKSYPIIENIYAGPQDAFVPKNFMVFSEMQSLAELGFIVVQIDGMGTANRSKAFHDVCWHNLADAGLPDRILWMKSLAKAYPFVDDSRVGVYGTSAGGQNSLGALLFHPDFYKVAVSACGCHDNRVDKQWWNEQWMGYPVGPQYAEQSNVTNAAKLKGNLLLIVGENDSNVPPESTYRVADALIKANKNFDLLTVPGMGHSDGGPFGRHKKRDFFVKNLLNVATPEWNSL
ncbi:MAG: prolyl oligopeptidase family serine peptidase, partial [Ginsengibacter sp.]